MAADQGVQHGAAPMQFTENRKGLDSMGVPAPEPVTLPASSGGGGAEAADSVVHAQGAGGPPVDYDG